MTRVAVVGAGMVGATTAARIAEARLCDDVALIDVAGDLARAMALDIGSSLPLLGSDTTLTGGESYEQARGADVVVITAGRPAPARAEPRRPARGQRPHRRGGLRERALGRARRRRDRGHEPARRDDDARPGRARLPARARRRHGRPARHRALPPLPGRARRRAAEHGAGAHAGLARRHDGAALAHGDGRRPPCRPRRSATRRSARSCSARATAAPRSCGCCSAARPTGRRAPR